MTGKGATVMLLTGTAGGGGGGGIEGEGGRDAPDGWAEPALTLPPGILQDRG